MASIENLTNITAEPGDTLRHRRSKVDYILHSVATLTAGGGAVYMLVNAANNSLEEHVGKTFEDLDMMVVRKNAEELTPNDVFKWRKDHLEQSLKGNQDLTRKIELSESGNIRDLLLLLKDVDDKTTKTKLLSLADQFLLSKNHSFSQQEILDTLKTSLGENLAHYGDEYLETLSKDIHTEINTRIKANTLRRFRRTPNVDFSRESISKRVGGAAEDSGLFSPSRDSKFISYIQNGMFGRNGSIDFGIYQGLPGKVKNARKAETRAKKLIEQVLQREPDAGLVSILSDMSSRKESANVLGALMDADKTGMFAGMHLRYLGLQTKEGYKLQNRRTALQSKYRGRVTKRHSIKDLLSDPTEVYADGSERIFAIKQDSLIHDVLKGKKLTIDGKNYSPGDFNVSRMFKHQLKESESVFVSAKQIRKINAGDSVDLKDLFSNHSNIRDAVEPETRAKFAGLMDSPTTNYSKRPVIEFGLNRRTTEEFAPKVGSVYRVTAGRKEKYFSGLAFQDAKQYASEIGGTIEEGLKPPGISIPHLTGETVQDAGIRFSPVPMTNASTRATSVVTSVSPVRTGKAYSAAREQSRMGYAMLTDSTGKQAVRLFGTDMSVDAHKQLSRGLDASRELDKSSVILDVLGGENGLQNIGLGYRGSDGKVASLVNFNGGSVEEEIAALAKTAEHLSDASFVGSRTSYHTNQLFERIHSLKSRDLDFTVDLFGKKVQAGDALTQIENILQDTSANKSYDLVSLAHASGKTNIGNSGIANLTRKLFNEEPTTPGMDAVEQSFEINKRLKIDNLWYGESKSPDKLFYGSNTRNGLNGEFLRLKAIENSGVDTGVEAVFERMHLLPSGKVLGTGTHVSLQTENAHMMGAEIGKLRELPFDGTSVSKPIAEHYHDLAQKRIDDASGRIVRAINPITKSTYNRVGSIGTITKSAYGLEQFTVAGETRRLLGDPVDRIRELRKLMGSGMHEDDAVKQVIDQLMGNAHLPVLEESKEAFEASLRFNLEEAVRSPKMMGMFTSDNDLTRALDSKFGGYIMGLTRRGLDGDTKSVHQAMLSVTHAMKRGAMDSVEGSNLTVFNPRLGLNIGKNSRPFLGSVSTNLDSLTNMSEVELSVRELAGQTLMSFGTTGDRNSTKILSQIYNEDELKHVRELVTKYAQDLNVGGDIPNLNFAISGLQHIKGGEFGELGDAVNQILESDTFKHKVKESILQRKKSFLKHYSVVDGVDADGIAENIHSGLDNAFSAHGRADYAVRDFIKSAYSTDKDGTLAYFSDVRTGSSIEHLMPNITREEIQQIAKKSAGQVATFTDEKGGSALLTRILEAAYTIKDKAFRAKMPSNEQSRLVSSFVDSTVQAVSVSPTSFLTHALNEVGTEYQTIASKGKFGPTQVEQIQEVAAKAVSLNVEKADDVFKDFLRGQHEGFLGKPIVDLAKNKTMVGALLAVGGIAALMSATHNPKENYSGGEESKKAPRAINQISEIPGDMAPPNVFTGQTEPFRLKIDMKGFVKNRRDLQAVTERVNNITSKYADGDFRSTEHTTKDKPVRLTAYQELMKSLR